MFKSKAQKKLYGKIRFKCKGNDSLNTSNGFANDRLYGQSGILY